MSRARVRRLVAHVLFESELSGVEQPHAAAGVARINQISRETTKLRDEQTRAAAAAATTDRT